MKTWKSKLAGDNSANFYGWILTGLLLFGASFFCVMKAIQVGAYSSPTCLLLAAIYFIAVGHFGIALQSYCARVAKNFEAEDTKKIEKKDDKPTA